MKSLTLIAMSLCLFPIFGQELRPEIRTIVAFLAQSTTVVGQHIGVYGEVPDLYEQFEQLREKADTSELQSLLVQENKVVRTYASWALIDRRFSRLDVVFATIMAQQDSVWYHFFCDKYPESVTSLFYNRVYYQYTYNKTSLKVTSYFDLQLQVLDSMLIYGYNRGEAFKKALKNNQGSLKHIQRIKYLAEVEMNPEAKKEYKYCKQVSE